MTRTRVDRLPAIASAWGREARALAVVVLIFIATPVCGLALAETSATAPGWIDWNGDSFFQPCHGDCALSIYGGKQVTTAMTRVFFLEYPPRPFWEWHWRNSEFIAAAFSRHLVTFWDALSFEPEFGLGQRFGEMHATEMWGAMNIRWTRFPWNHYLKTTVGVAEGISYATEIDERERLLDDPHVVGNQVVYNGSNIMNFFSPTVTFALPQYPQYELLIRWHHRSGIFGLINDTHAGAQFFSAGMRVNF